jgi:Holliday junction resolvase RusA-like endonuclease
MKAQYREDCGWLIFAGGPAPFYPPVTAQVTFVVTDARRRDSDNFMAMLKPMWDALVAQGVLQDDSHDKLKILEPKWERGPEKKVVVELSGAR